jgi:SnoaL-like polyketide cyclase
LDSEGWKRFLAGFVDALPDLRLTVEDAVGEGDLVAQRIHFEGTHTGEFQGLPPTNTRVLFYGLELSRFADGRVREHWFQMDCLSLLQQLGLVVVPGPGCCRASSLISSRNCAGTAEQEALTNEHAAHPDPRLVSPRPFAAPASGFVRQRVCGFSRSRRRKQASGVLTGGMSREMA